MKRISLKEILRDEIKHEAHDQVDVSISPKAWVIAYDRVKMPVRAQIGSRLLGKRIWLQVMGTILRN